ncbi:hypothetical protein FQA39_LY01695 [Lamprigera yunnana]|nr:hypothetical protein FQA39_LY01695 [Lamprigera yunnana]
MYVCEDHFSDDCWYSSEKKKLKKFAIPSRFSASLTSVKVVSEHDYCLPCVSDVSPHTPNVRQPVKCNNTVDNNCDAKNITDCLNNSVKEVIPEITTKINNGGILHNISATRTSQLSPRKRKMYYMNRTQQSRMLKLKHHLNASRDMCRSLKNCSYVNLLDDISINLNPAVTYVCGFLVKKMKNVECINCYNNLIVSKPESHHFFTRFKEYDVKLRLKYVSRNVALYIAYIHDVVNVFTQLYGSISNIFEKIQTMLLQNDDFAWFQCDMHKNEVKLRLLKYAIQLLINKYVEDVQRKYADNNKYVEDVQRKYADNNKRRHVTKKVNTLKHV